MQLNERGNIALNNPDVNASILIAKTGEKDGEYLISAFNGNNYPKWNVYTYFFYGEELADWIMEEFQDWFVDKLNGVDVNVSTGYDNCTYIMDRDEVMNEIVSHATGKAADGDYNLDSDDMIENAVGNSANTLKYFLTEKLKADTIIELEFEVNVY